MNGSRHQRYLSKRCSEGCEETTLYQRCSASILSSDRPSKIFEPLIALAECHQGREADIALS